MHSKRPKPKALMPIMFERAYVHSVDDNAIIVAVSRKKLPHPLHRARAYARFSGYFALRIPTHDHAERVNVMHDLIANDVPFLAGDDMAPASLVAAMIETGELRPPYKSIDWPFPGRSRLKVIR